VRAVVDHAVGAERLDEGDVARAADRGHVRAELLGELDGRAPDTAGGAVDEHPLTRLQLRATEHVERRRAAEEDRGRVAEREVRGLGYEQAVLREDAELGVRTHRGTRKADHRVADREARDLRADRLHDARELGPEDRLARAAPPDRELRDPPEALRELAAAHAPVAAGDGGRDDTHEHVAGTRHGCGNLAQLEDVGGTVVGTEDGAHSGSSPFGAARRLHGDGLLDLLTP
jgi:hypothetical protein